MKIAKLLHNPKAGNKDHTAEKLVKLIEAQGYECHYTSVKKDGWDKIEPGVDLLVVAGGDGTIRKVVNKLLKRRISDRRLPIAVLPLGTANNIGKSLNLSPDLEELVESWSTAVLKSCDIGKIEGLDDDYYFMEGVGFGVFPSLMNDMHKRKESEKSEDKEQELLTALARLKEITLEYKPRECKLEIDGVDHSGKFLLVEIMNTPSVGPNLELNPTADMGDGEFEIIIVPESQRDKLLDYLDCKIKGEDEVFGFSALKAKDIKITWEGVHVHVDDEVVKLKSPIVVEAEIRAGVFDFVVPVSNDTDA